ncbi:MAG TPA: carboxypeptidase regulatory-like domain-containing protein [Gemmatimonadaceae bacterium]|nr:carboxypeptidase regulatory-like domain-containing protein [Gemmatimonadaceae bacterium]
MVKIGGSVVHAAVCCLALTALVAGSGLAQVVSGAAERATATVTGVVYDSLARAPLAGAEVQLVREGVPGERSLFDVTTDSRGHFAIANVPPGPYTAGFLHPFLDTLGVVAPVVHVALEAGRTTELPLAIPSLTTFARALCHLQTVPDSATLWVGTVRDAATRAPRARASVSVQWAETDITRGGIYRMRRSGVVQAGEDGRFAVCNAPADASLFVRAAGGPDTSGVVVLNLPGQRLLARDLLIGRSEPAQPESTVLVDGTRRGLAVPRRGQARLVGTVRASLGNPIAGARVRLAGASDSAATAGDGSFRLAGLPAGSWMLDVRAIGFEPARVPVELYEGEGTTNTRSVVLEKAVTALETVRVITGPANVPARSGFLSRKVGFGHFIEHAEIEKRSALEVRDIVRDVPGLLVVPHVPGGGPSLLMRVPSGMCAPSVWVDGQRFGGGYDAEQMLAMINPADVAGIEVYNRSGIVPLQFGGTLTGGCGVIVGWTDSRLRARAKPPG